MIKLAIQHELSLTQKALIPVMVLQILLELSLVVLEVLLNNTVLDGRLRKERSCGWCLHQH